MSIRLSIRRRFAFLTGCHNAPNFKGSAKSLTFVQEVNKIKGLKVLQIVTSKLVASYLMKK